MRPTDQALLLALERQREGRESRLPVLGRRDTVPAALQYSSTTQGDSRGLLGSHEDNKLEPNPLSLFGLGAKVVRRHHLTKREGSGSTPAASTKLFIFIYLSPPRAVSAAATTSCRMGRSTPWCHCGSVSSQPIWYTP